MAWDILILKILAVRPTGQATTVEISRDLAIVDQAGRGSTKPCAIPGGLFGAKLVTSPQRGVWRITDLGRHYLNNPQPDSSLVDTTAVADGMMLQ